MSRTVLFADVSYAKAEGIFANSTEMARNTWRYMGVAKAACNAVRAKDPRMLVGFEQCLKVLNRAYEEQLGETQRRASVGGANKAKPPVMAAYEDAYRLMDSGPPPDPQGQRDWENSVVNYAYFYASMGYFTGALV